MGAKKAIENALVEAQIAALKSDGADAMSPDMLKAMSNADPTLAEATNRDDKIGRAFVEDDDELITVYSTFNGVSSIVLVSMLGKQMKKRFGPVHSEVPESMWGKQAFSLRQLVKPDVRELKCMFHEDHPLRKELDSIGVMMRCIKANMPNEDNVLLHAEHRHRAELKSYNRHIEKRERDEDREMQRELSRQLAEIAKASAPKRGRPAKEND